MLLKRLKEAMDKGSVDNCVLSTNVTIINLGGTINTYKLTASYFGYLYLLIRYIREICTVDMRKKQLRSFTLNVGFDKMTLQT